MTIALPPIPPPPAPVEGETPSEVRIKEISNNMGYSAELARYMLERNEAFISNLGDVVSDKDLEAAIDLDGIYISNTTPPEIRPSDIDEPSMPSVTLFGAPTLPELPEISSRQQIQIPTLDAQMERLNMPNTPNPAKPDLPDAPEVNDIDLPVAPTLPVFDVPEVGDIDIPDAPDIPVLPEFVDDFPVFDITAPSNEFDYDEEEYSSALNDLIRSKLIEYINEGGTGLSEAFETAVFDRARVRAVDATRRAIDEIDDEISSAGWPTPPGSRDARQRRRLRDHLNTELEIIDKILIQQTQLAHEWSKFIYQSGITFEDIMIKHFNSVADRVVLAMRATVETAIAVYNARVNAYNTQVERVKIASEIYLAKIRGNSQQIDIYRALLQGKETEARVKEVMVNVYRAQLEGNRALVDVYTAQMNGARVASEVERNKVAIFGEQISAYRAQLEGNIAEFSAYKANIDGELAKVTVYTSELDAYKAELGAIESESRIRESESREKVQQGQLQVEGYRAQVASLGAKVSAYEAAVRHGLGLLDSRTNAYRANAAVDEANARLYMKNVELSIEAKKFNAVVENNEVLQRFRNLEAQASIRTVAAKGAAGALSGIAQAALSQYTSIAQIMSSVETIQEDAPADDSADAP